MGLPVKRIYEPQQALRVGSFHLRLVTLRHTLQITLAFYLLYLGWQFYRFVRHFETSGATPLVPRPSAVEGFLPIKAVMALKQLVLTGIYDPIHPAALTIFLAVVLVAFLFRKGFCSYICPVGTVSEFVGKLGAYVFGRNYKPPKLLDRLLMIPKYLLLYFFLNSILKMNLMQLNAFLQSPYSYVADVKMLYFFIYPTDTKLIILGFLIIFSLFIKHFWCRYLCPYGALLGLTALVSPLWRVTRDPEQCLQCGSCARVCPNSLDVDKVTRVNSPECSGCLTCVSSCPRPHALQYRPLFTERALNPFWAPVLVFGTFFLIIGLAKLTGYWETVLTYEHYARYIPSARYIGH